MDVGTRAESDTNIWETDRRNARKQDESEPGKMKIKVTVKGTYHNIQSGRWP